MPKFPSAPTSASAPSSVLPSTTSRSALSRPRVSKLWGRLQVSLFFEDPTVFHLSLFADILFYFGHACRHLHP
jgi:hypothetical protein